ncbi:1-aminocyclopropane-1-carboxylate deaminase/D-cysteine desulfhydrase [Ulvibacter antarcticus]|uniref:1-aminocyclopropane-1-carboxylate deaminase n=1 Tax=Ulvibacter antarcticus TaxID=442714 RepID=A0A3L9YDZ7_9FLAO|nr:pyridoxal-phosphate dependent enzyme [Ulvibacter antarcticus]RMA57670.1 1-aminocyclopropane-1-carboxylate deaminase [Ulvibacter antarcticus]
MFENQLHIVNETIVFSPFSSENIQVVIKREDKIHPFISGNKFRKLKYNVGSAIESNKASMLTFGGAYSNHIAAVASAGRLAGLKTIGIIRGEELANNYFDNATLCFAEENGMELHFISREAYREKEDQAFIKQLKQSYGDFYLIPEGGTNELAIKGCAEILTEADKEFDYICTAVGTGGTLAGLVKASEEHQHILGFSALKGNFQKKIVNKFSSKTNFAITDDYCFGGYAKIDSELIRFINTFRRETTIPLDPVYTAKMMFGISDLIKSGYFKENSRILAIHTGGLQGIAGMNQMLKKKQMQQIDI